MSYDLTTMQYIYHNQDEIVEITYNGSLVYQKSSGPDYTEPFYVENISNNVETLSVLKNNESAPTLTIEYSTDKATWNTLGTTSTTALTYTLQPNEKIYLRCNTNAWASSLNVYNHITGVSKVGGNTMSLLYGNYFTGNETNFPDTTLNSIFCRLFYLGNIIDASCLLLPATTLVYQCYGCMFMYCPLTAAPALPATTLARSCYREMFRECRSLTTAPELPATTLVDNCYWGMFNGCTSLSSAPELPATTLVNNCYLNMFIGCTLLNTVKCLATDISASNATSDWLSNVAASGTFTCAVGMSQTWPTGASGIPEGWTAVEV